MSDGLVMVYLELSARFSLRDATISALEATLRAGLFSQRFGYHENALRDGCEQLASDSKVGVANPLTPSL